jgi:hypothetical protein
MDLPVLFHPGTGDKFIFKMLAEESERKINPEESERSGESLIAARTMLFFYYPQYEEYDRKQIEEAMELDNKKRKMSSKLNNKK